MRASSVGLVFALAFHASLALDASSCQKCGAYLQNFAKLVQGVDKHEFQKSAQEWCSAIGSSPVCERIGMANMMLVDKTIELLGMGNGCELLDVCGTEAEELIIEFGEQFNAVISSLREPRADARCELCQFMVKEIDYLLKNNKTIAEIKQGLEKFCDSLSLKEKLACKAAVPLIMKELEDGIDPKHACEAINMCPNNTDISLMLKSLRCEGCKKLIDFVDRQVYTRLDWIKSFGDELCHRFPPDTDKACLDFVDNHLEESLSKILNTTLSPGHVCTTYLHLCH